jgi:hypothetical protein
VTVGKGTVLSINVEEQISISLQVQNDSNNFEITVSEGIAKITCLNDDGLKSISIINELDQSKNNVIDVTSCDLIFCNENKSLPNDVLPSLKAEYRVVAKLVVKHNNYYGVKELTGFMIID